jgi:phosphatidate phosphatase APP1
VGNVFCRGYGLIGDSGEKDPEIYSAIAQRYPRQVKHVFIRNVQPDRMQARRFGEVFNALNQNRWTVFEKTDEIIFRDE